MYKNSVFLNQVFLQYCAYTCRNSGWVMDYGSWLMAYGPRRHDLSNVMIQELNIV